MGFYTTIQKNEHIMAWMNLQNVMPNKRNQTQKSKYV